MKWIAVILVMVNLVVFLLMKSYPGAVQAVSDSDSETINESAMTVLPPEAQTEELVAVEADESSDLVEEDLAQLKMDDRGKVLMARNDKTADENKKQNSKQATKPTASAKLSEPKTTAPVLKPLDRNEKPAAVAKVSPASAEMSVVNAEPVAKPKPKSKQEPEPVSEPVPAVVEEIACYRIGPFSNQKQLANARRKLESANVAYTVEDKTAPGKIKAARVYLGAFSDTAKLEAEKSRLSKMKIDHFVIVLNGERLIQLGYYSNPAGAKRVQQDMIARNVDAKIATEYKDTRIESWLNIKSASKAEIDTLGLPAGMSKRNEACR